MRSGLENWSSVWRLRRGLEGYAELLLLLSIYVSDSYFAGRVQGDCDVGGLAGGSLCGEISKCYWDIQTSNEPDMCGNPEDPNYDDSYGKATAEMKQQSTFADWDFVNVWDIGENQTYPYLRTVPAGDINKDKTVNFLDLCIVAEQWCVEE